MNCHSWGEKWSSVICKCTYLGNSCASFWGDVFTTHRQICVQKCISKEKISLFNREMNDTFQKPTLGPLSPSSWAIQQKKSVVHKWCVFSFHNNHMPSVIIFLVCSLSCVETKVWLFVCAACIASMIFIQLHFLFAIYTGNLRSHNCYLGIREFFTLKWLGEQVSNATIVSFFN